MTSGETISSLIPSGRLSGRQSQALHSGAWQEGERQTRRVQTGHKGKHFNRRKDRHQKRLPLLWLEGWSEEPLRSLPTWVSYEVRPLQKKRHWSVHNTDVTSLLIANTSILKRSIMWPSPCLSRYHLCDILDCIKLKFNAIYKCYHIVCKHPNSVSIRNCKRINIWELILLKDPQRCNNFASVFPGVTGWQCTRPDDLHWYALIHLHCNMLNGSSHIGSHVGFLIVFLNLVPTSRWKR